MTGRATPARAGEIRIGISSWGGLPGFYPSNIKSAEKLAWFARFFSVVEVNVSFYRLVPPHTYVNWAELTPYRLYVRRQGISGADALPRSAA